MRKKTSFRPYQLKKCLFWTGVEPGAGGEQPEAGEHAPQQRHLQAGGQPSGGETEASRGTSIIFISVVDLNTLNLGPDPEFWPKWLRIRIRIRIHSYGSITAVLRSQNYLISRLHFFHYFGSSSSPVLPLKNGNFWFNKIKTVLQK